MKSISRNRIMFGTTLGMSTLGALMLIVMTLGVTAFGATTISYHLANTYKFGAAPGDREYFDYITFDPDSRRLYLSHGSEVVVVNADTGAEEGKISGLKQSHGVAVVPEVGRGFISDGAQGKAIIFDLKTLKGWARRRPRRTPTASFTIRRRSISLLSTATARARRRSIRLPETMW